MKYKCEECGKIFDCEPGEEIVAHGTFLTVREMTHEPRHENQKTFFCRGHLADLGWHFVGEAWMPEM